MEGIAVYNVDDKKLVALIKDVPLASKIIFGKDVTFRKKATIYQSINRKSIILKSILGYRIALRNINAEQKIILENKQFVILDESIKVPFDYLLKFNESRLSLYTKCADASENIHPNSLIALKKRKGNSAPYFTFNQLGNDVIKAKTKF